LRGCAGLESIRGRKLATFSWLYPHHIFGCAEVAVSTGLLHLLELGRDEKHADLTIAPSVFPHS